jgi:hypothetical protein
LPLLQAQVAEFPGSQSEKTMHLHDFSISSTLPGVHGPTSTPPSGFGGVPQLQFVITRQQMTPSPVRTNRFIMTCSPDERPAFVVM